MTITDKGLGINGGARERVLLAALMLAALALFPPSLTAQWDIQIDPDMQGAVVNSVVEMHCGASQLVFAGTSQGVYLDPSGKAVAGRWLDVSTGLPGDSRSVHTLMVRDSLIFAAIYGDGVYYTKVSIRNVPACRPLEWLPYGRDLFAPLVNDMYLKDSTLYVATDDGIYHISTVPDTALDHGQNARLHEWQHLDDTYRQKTLAVFRHRNNVVAGSFLQGADYYDVNCDTAVFDCRWIEATTQPEFTGVSVYDIAGVDLAGTSLITDFEELPCTGVSISVGNDNNLYFAPVQTTEGTPSALDWWINISPSRTNAKWKYKINTILAVDLPSAPHTMFVGTEYGGVLMSDDCGASWQSVNDGLDAGKGLQGADVRSLAVINGETLLAGANDGGFFQGGAFARASLRQLTQNATGINPLPQDTTIRSVRLQVSTDIDNTSGRAKLTVPVENLVDVDIAAYNLLGKRVLEIFTGELKNQETDFTFNISGLHSGIYLCIVKGDNFKQAEKFVVSR